MIYSPGQVKGLIISLSRHRMPDTTARIVHVACIAGDDMTVEVEYRLPRCRTTVHADIESIWLMIQLNDAPRFLNGRIEVCTFFRIQLEVVGLQFI